MAGAGKVSYGPPGQPPLRSDTPSIRLRIRPAGSKTSIYLRAVDERGRPVAEAHSGYQSRPVWLAGEDPPAPDVTVTDFSAANNSSGSEGLASPMQYDEETIFFKIPKGARKLRLTFAVNKPRYFEFVVAPRGK
jgi:hypothetical protein